MFGRETRMLLRHYLEQGTSKSALARRLGVHRDTIYRWIRDGELDRDIDGEAVRYGPRRPVATKLDAYRPIVEARLAAYPRLSAVRLLEEIRAAGYTGGYSQLKAAVRQLRPVPPPEAVVRFETSAGHQAQVDFAEFQFPWGKRYALLVVLGYSRLLWCRFGPRQDMRTLLTGLEDAFLAFGGVPRELLFDQMKAVITRDLRLHGGALVHNLEFLRFAHHWGFAPRACRPYRAQTKGKVERPVRYLREHLVYGRTFLNDADLGQQCADWLGRVANARCHATTQERPRERFDRDERAALQPLPSRRYTSLVLDTPAVTRPLTRPPLSVITVEKRPLSAYARLAGGAA
ncbi:MAG: IS21 family transposase [Gammaproteobacteria bacterium]|nr:IS21 family transposase [Gammaproteobacteria bacterium]